MNFKKLYNTCVPFDYNEGGQYNNNYTILCASGLVHEEVNSACFAAMERFKDFWGLRHDGVRFTKPVSVDYYVNYHSRVTCEAYEFWLKSITGNVILGNYIDEANKYDLGFLTVNCNVPGNLLLFTLAMLRCTREFSRCVVLAYKLRQAIGDIGLTPSQQRKLDMLICLLATQYDGDDSNRMPLDNHIGWGHIPLAGDVKIDALCRFIQGDKSYLAGAKYNNTYKFDKVSHALDINQVGGDTVYGILNKYLPERININSDKSCKDSVKGILKLFEYVDKRGAELVKG